MCLWQKFRYREVAVDLNSILLFTILPRLCSGKTLASKNLNVITPVLDVDLVYILNYIKTIGIVGFYGKRPKR